MRVYIERTGKTVEVRAGSVKELLKRLNMRPNVVLVVKNGELVTENAGLTEKDEVKVLSVISGG